MYVGMVIFFLFLKLKGQCGVKSDDVSMGGLLLQFLGEN